LGRRDRNTRDKISWRRRQKQLRGQRATMRPRPDWNVRIRIPEKTLRCRNRANSFFFVTLFLLQDGLPVGGDHEAIILPLCLLGRTRSPHAIRPLRFRWSRRRRGGVSSGESLSQSCEDITLGARALGRSRSGLVSRFWLCFCGQCLSRLARGC
jgi:hypothetical protein